MAVEAARPHFTYAEPHGGHLQQGDLIAKTDGLAAVLGQVHPHYQREDYTHFLVLTQSCDLVLRGGKCASRYVSIAAVRSLRTVLEREISLYQNDLEREGMVCSMRVRQRVENFVERLLNNNEPEYFYLHEEPALGIHDRVCAFLRLSIAIRADLHYQTCLDARVASLTEIFQAKLGWLVGNMYSRIGTEDWVPRHRAKDDFLSEVRDLLDATCEWVPEDQLSEARRTAPAGLIGQGREAVRRHVAGVKLLPKKDRVIVRVGEIVDSVMASQGTQLTPQQMSLLRDRLRNDPGLAVVLK